MTADPVALRGLAAHPCFVTAQTLHTRLPAEGGRIGLTTVYRTLHMLAEAGLPDTARDPSEGQLFRICHARDHQHYLICRSCRRSVPVTSASVERWASVLGHRHGFTDVQHVIELTGVCAACRSRAGDPGSHAGHSASAVRHLSGYAGD